jgi:succinate dehydrogenase/fumarate reductase flavoprotein subunit
MGFERIPSYWILDDAAIRKGPLVLPLGYGFAKYSWSPDNRKEIQVGWIKAGNSLEELASKMEYLVTTKNLESAVKRYNDICKSGYDADYGRPKVTLFPIQYPPYYAMPVYPALYNTCGGPKRNKNAQIVDPWNKPIPRLYSAGSLGSIYSFLYQCGGDLTECLAFGRRAGEQSAALNPWDM